MTKLAGNSLDSRSRPEKEDDQSRVDRCIQELLDDAKGNRDLTEKVNRFGVYLNGN